MKPNIISKIPVLNTPDKALSTTSQDWLPVADIIEDVVLFKDGGAAIILESTSLNFGLLSDKEQQAVIYAYAALLNSLSFPIQVLVRSQKKDITNYINYIDAALQQMQNLKLKELMADYKNFISETVKKKNVLGKRFFIVIPFSSLELGVTKSFLNLTKRKGPLPFSRSYVLEKAQIILYPKRDHLMRQAGRMGLKLKVLNKEQLIELFYDVFNPVAPQPQPTNKNGTK